LLGEFLRATAAVGEDPAAYDELLARVSGAVKPSDVLEEIWVRDVVDLVWEALWLRRLKAELIAANTHEGLEQILVPLTDWDSADALAKAWLRRDSKAIKEIDKLLRVCRLNHGFSHGADLGAQVRSG
jgi:hypothetical protein